MGLEIVLSVNGVADAELASASTVEIQERMGEATTFSLRYDVDINGGDIPLLIDKRLNPGSQISILVPADNAMHCLVNGLVHGHQIHLVHGGTGSWIEVNGSDTSMRMDRKTTIAVWSDVTDSDAVSSILRSHEYLADVQPTKAGHLEAKHTLIQRESDLRFIRRLARRNGYLFWITSDANCLDTAHFKRPPLDDGVMAELVINLASPSIEELDIDWDLEQPDSVVGRQLDLNSLTELDGSVRQTPQSVLGSKGLQQIREQNISVHLTAPADDAGDLQSRGEGVLIEADWFIRASCRTNLASVGKPLRAHTVVELRGAGSRHSGKYFVSGVRHIIDASNHRMELELVRNGWEA